MSAEPNIPHERALRVLLLEDSDIDTELLIGHLYKAGIDSQITRAATRHEFLAALQPGDLDIVLADYSLPDFDGLSALELVRRLSPDLPFIFVSGVVGEEFAINALRRGATDYVMKRGLNRLPAAVDRAIAEAREKQERQRAEQALRMSETSTQLAIDAAGLGKWEYDPIADRLSWDMRCRALFGVSASVPVDHELFFARCHALDRDRLERALRKAMLPGHSGDVSEECRIIRLSDGDERWLSLRGRSFFENGACTRFIGVVADVTDRKRQETDLQELNETLKLRVERQNAERDYLWQLSQDLLSVADPSGALIEVNPAWSSVLGYDIERLAGKHFAEFAHPDDLNLTQSSVAMAARAKLRPFECRFRCKNGGYRHVSWSAAPGHGCIYFVGRDVTEDREAQMRLAHTQEALRQAQKMEAVGQLTGGVAHDFNNLLQIVVGNLETLQSKLPSEMTRLRRAADHAMAGARRAANLTQHLLAFSRRQPLNPRPIDINRLVESTTEMLRRSLGELVEIDTELDPELWPVELDENQLEIALLNLAVNARDAMPDGGQLRIQTFNVDAEKRRELAHADLADTDHIALCVIDTGTGMTPEVIAHAFEPFYTTKGIGQGTGLGLSQVYGFVTQSGGRVMIESEPSLGTQITMHFPRLMGAVEVPDSADDCDTIASTASETILVVEDDPDVRGYTVEAIRELGYKVLEARDGPSALKVLAQAPTGSVDLLFTDVVLPGGMNGQQLAQVAQSQLPSLKVLFASGYARDAIVHHGRLDPGVQLIAKPFVQHELAARLRHVLDGTGIRREARN
ncbi:MAG: response regulator [Povalibacter sp.]